MIVKFAASATIVIVLLLGVSYSEDLSAWISDSFWPSAKEPIPTLELKPRPYKIKVIAEGRLTGLVTTGINAPKVRGSLRIAWLIDEGAIVRQGDTLIRFDDTDAELALEKHENELSTLSSRLEKTVLDRRGTQERLAKEKEAARVEFDYARNQIRQDQTIFSQWEIAESLVSAELAESRLGHLAVQESLHDVLAQADGEILDIERKTAQGEVERARETLNSLEVRAPEDGVVLYKRVWRPLEVGGEVWSEQPLMEIAPQSRLRGELDVVETEIAGVAVGKPVEVILPAVPDHVFPGEVTKVAQVADQLRREDPRRYFVCRINVDIPAEMLPSLKPGMQLRGEIVIADYEAALVLPRSAVFKEEGRFKVFVADGGAFRESEVTIEGADHGFYVVSGLQAGDRVCLRHPFNQEKLHLPDFTTPSGPAGGRGIVVFFN